MSKRWIVPLASVLMAANSAFGQGAERASSHWGLPEAPEDLPILRPLANEGPNDITLLKAASEQPPEQLPPPLAETSPSAPIASPASEIWHAPTTELQLPLPIVNVIDSSRYGLVTAEADYMIWFPKANLGTVPASTSAMPGSEDDMQLKTSKIIGGGRFTLGYWETEDNPWVPEGIRDYGVEARFFFVGSGSATINNDMATPLYRPFFDVNTNSLASFLVAEPGVAAGVLTARAQASLWGGELNAWKNVCFNTPGTSYAIGVMAGLRYLNASSSIGFYSNTLYDAAPSDPTYAAFAGNRVQVADSFSTHNNFFGGQIGAGFNCWFEQYVNFEGSLRVALGNTSQDLAIAGGQLRTFANGTTASYVGGLLALPSNIGTYHLDKFTQVPEVDFKINIPVASYLTLSIGFSGMYWDRVLLASQQIQRTIDVSQLPNYAPGAGATSTGFAHPLVPFTQSNLSVLGISVGAEFRY